MALGQEAVRREALEFVTYRTRQYLSDFELAYAEDPEMFYDYACKALVIELDARVAADDEREWKIEYPATWWDALKWRFAPQWFLNRWPVTFTVHEFSARIVYPELRKKFPKEKHATKLEYYAYSTEYPVVWEEKEL